MAANAEKNTVGKSKSMSLMMMLGLSFRFSRKKKSKKEYSSQVHLTTRCELSQAWEIARPYRPRLVLNLQTIREEEDPSKTPCCEDATRTPLYFTRGTSTKRFRLRLRRYAKLMWRVHYAAKLRRNFSGVLRLFRITRDTDPHAASGLSVMKI